jgi:hypothetical protein
MDNHKNILNSSQINLIPLRAPNSTTESFPGTPRSTISGIDTLEKF